MKNKRIIVPVGFPGSGKTSFIRGHRHTHHSMSITISGDALRVMMHHGVYHFDGPETDRIICTMIEMAKTFLPIYPVIYLDEYYISYNKQSRANLVTLFDGLAKVEFYPMDSDIGKCIHRRCTDTREDDTSRWPNVLLAMTHDFEPLEAPYNGNI